MRYTDPEYFSVSYLYRLSVSSSSGFVPRFTEAGSRDVRHLGVLVRPRVEPAVSFGGG